MFKGATLTMTDNYLNDLIKFRTNLKQRRNGDDHDNYRQNGGFLYPYHAMSSSSSTSTSPPSTGDGAERVPRLLFFVANFENIFFLHSCCTCT